MTDRGVPGQDVPLIRASEEAMRRQQAQRRWRAGLAVLAVVVVVMAAVTVVASVKGTSHPSTTNTDAGGGNSHGQTTTSTTPGTPGGPTITSLSPDAGSTGQAVVVSGTKLFSPNGNVQVRFGPVTAPTSCHSETSCTATVPSGLTAGTVTVTVSTASGVSNGVPFTYR
ncbi:MAG: IPT/TIG domain-containing protein [Acidimicrobiales bacterium]